MDRLEPEVLKMIADALHELLQCPVCLATLRPPLAQCASGHAICPDCRPQIQFCPSCRQDFIATKPLVLQQLLEVLPRSCQFRALGCTDVNLASNDHEDVCCYRTVQCKIIDCEWSGQMRKLEQHLDNSHCDMVRMTEGVNTVVTWENFNCSQDSYKYVAYLAYNQVFWEYIHMNPEVKKLCLSYTHLSTIDTNCDYYAVIRFKNGEIEYAYTIKIPSEGNQLLNDFYEECCMTVPGDMVSRFVNGSSRLTYNVRIIMEKKQ